jgi:hypothetical protein
MSRASLLLPIIRLTPRVRARLAFKRHMAIIDGRKMAGMLSHPESQEFMRFMRSLHTTDQGACWLALHKAKTHHLTLAHAAHFAQKELNDFARANAAFSVKMPETDRMSSAINPDSDMRPAEKPAMMVAESKLAARFRETKTEKEEKQDTKRWAMALIHNDEKYFSLAPDFLLEHYAKLAKHEQQVSEMLDLQYSVKPRDRLMLNLRFYRGLSIPEIAVGMGKTTSAIYAAFERMRPILSEAKKQKDCVHDEMPDIPVVLGADGQICWDMDVQP